LDNWEEVINIISYPKNNNQIDILKGIQIDDPKVFIPWDISNKDIEVFFHNCSLSRITNNYYAIYNTKLFGTLICNVGLHFDNILKRIEFFRNDYTDLQKSYDEFQTIFETKFGKPTRKIGNPINFDSCEWSISNNIVIYHHVMDRFGLEEHMYIERI